MPSPLASAKLRDVDLVDDRAAPPRRVVGASATRPGRRVGRCGGRDGARSGRRGRFGHGSLARRLATSPTGDNVAARRNVAYPTDECKNLTEDCGFAETADRRRRIRAWRRRRQRGRRRRPAGRAAHDELGLEQQLVGGDRASPAIWPISSSMTIRPIGSIGWRTVVSGGSVQFMSAESSKPTTETSSGTRSPAAPHRADRAERHRVAGAHDAGDAASRAAGSPPPGRPRASTASARCGPAASSMPALRRRSARARRACGCDGHVVARARAAGRSACGRARSGGPSPAPSPPRRRTRRAGSRGRRCAALTSTVGQAALGEPAVVAVRRVGLGVQPAGEHHARDLLLRAAARRSPPRTRRRRSGCTAPACSPAARGRPPTTSAKAGKIGFCSSGRTSPTSRARSPRSLVGRS